MSPRFYLDISPSWFEYPSEYDWLVKHKLTDLEPWYLLDGDELISCMETIIKLYPSYDAVPFARRQDNDDVACWLRDQSGTVQIIHIYASPGWEKSEQFPNFWEWFRSAIEEMILFQ